MQYLNTSGNFDSNGDEVDMTGSFGYKNITTSLDGAYYFGKGWAANAGLRFANAESSSNIEERSNSALTDVHIQGQKLLSWSRVRFVPEVGVLFTTDEITDTQDDVFLSEAVNVYSAGSWIITDLRYFKAYGFLGYDYRDDGRSNLLPWTAGFAIRASSAALLAEMGGYQTVANDEDTDTANELLRRNQNNLVNGTSLRYYSVNPDLTEVRLQAHYAFSRELSIFGGASHALMGKNTASGQVFTLGLTYNLDTGDPRLAKKRKPVRPWQRGDKVEDEINAAFEPLVEEDYDETLFEGDADGEL
jgi:hypothetical protein